MFDAEIAVLTRLARSQPQHEHDMLMSVVGVLEAARPDEPSMKREFFKLVVICVRDAKTDDEAIDQVALACGQCMAEGFAKGLQRVWRLRAVMQQAIEHLKGGAVSVAAEVLESALSAEQIGES